MIYLAQRRGQGLISIQDIASDQTIPKKLLEHILLELKKGGLLASKPGKQGGYSLKREPETIRLGHIVRLLDCSLAPVPCLSQHYHEVRADSPGEDQCVIRATMQEVHLVTVRLLEQTNLTMLMETQNRLNGLGHSPFPTSMSYSSEVTQ